MNNQDTPSTPVPAPTAASTPSHRFSSAALLWFSAFILLGLVIVQSGKLASGYLATARADVVSRVGEYTTITVANQSGEDLLMVVDGRGEQLFVYRILNQKQVELLKRYELPAMYTAGQRIGAGAGPGGRPIKP
jgi:hypothetical protein